MRQKALARLVIPPGRPATPAETRDIAEPILRRACANFIRSGQVNRHTMERMRTACVLALAEVWPRENASAFMGKITFLQRVGTGSILLVDEEELARLQGTGMTSADGAVYQVVGPAPGAPR